MSNFEDFNQYQLDALKTAMYPGAFDKNPAGLLYTALGLASEAGEFAGKVKKLLRDTDYLEDGLISESLLNAMRAELGDVLWYVSECARQVGITPLSLIAQENIDKLKSRQERDQIQGSGDNR